MTDKNAPEPIDNVSLKSSDADRTKDGFGKGEGYSGDEYDSADHAAERHLQNRDGAHNAGADEPADGTSCACGRPIGHPYWCSAKWDGYEMPRGARPLAFVHLVAVERAEFGDRRDGSAVNGVRGGAGKGGVHVRSPSSS